jgi:hypothetical protein
MNGMDEMNEMDEVNEIYDSNWLQFCSQKVQNL